MVLHSLRPAAAAPSYGKKHPKLRTSLTLAQNFLCFYLWEPLPCNTGSLVCNESLQMLREAIATPAASLTPVPCRIRPRRPICSRLRASLAPARPPTHSLPSSTKSFPVVSCPGRKMTRANFSRLDSLLVFQQTGLLASEWKSVHVSQPVARVRKKIQLCCLSSPVFHFQRCKFASVQFLILSAKPARLD